jgi:hypothetical protein
LVLSIWLVQGLFILKDTRKIKSLLIYKQSTGLDQNGFLFIG